jgi:hypothetical protein
MMAPVSQEHAGLTALLSGSGDEPIHESLAVLVLILMSTVFLSGPLGIIFTSKAVWNYSQKKKALWCLFLYASSQIYQLSVGLRRYILT